MASIHALKWWQKAVFYQIYPRSFADGNGDGIGDLVGMTQRLDYLKDLGVDGLWLSPHYPSPLYDCGYDVSDYCDVAPEYGTLEQFKRFLDEAHKRDIRVILDMVFNHTSDQHPWFLESRSSKNNPKRDWYIWESGKNGGPPNNWYSMFGGSAWELDPLTGEYYYHFFFKQQPDLNFNNPEVKQAMWDAVRFWLDMGVDGYRLDAIGTIYETPGLPNHKAKISQDEHYKLSFLASTPQEEKAVGKIWQAMYGLQCDQPAVHDLMKDLRKLVDEYPEKVLVGEADDIQYYGSGDDELHLAFNFPLLRTRLLSPAWVRKNQRERLSRLPDGAWPCNTLGNHDSPRVYNRFGDGEHNAAWARVNLALMLTLKGTPFLYNGEEIGMTDYLLADEKYFADQQSHFFLGLARSNPELVKPEEAMFIAAMAGRDKNRTPLQWANQPNAGFSPTGVDTWLPVNPNYAEGVNVEDQLHDPSSLLSYYRFMLKLRKETPALIAGEYEALNADANCLAFLRRCDEQTCLVVLNMTPKARRLNVALPGDLKLVYRTDDQRGVTLNFAPFEVFIAEVQTTR